MSPEPESLILQLLRDMRADMADMCEQMATKSDLAELRSEMTSQMRSLRADVAADFIDVRREIASTRGDLSGQIVGLRRAVIEYHTAVVGHGVIIGDLEAH